MIWRVIAFVIVILLITWIQVIRLLHRKQKKAAITYIIFMCLGVFIGSFILVGIHVPSPAIPIRAIFEPVGKMILSNL